MLFGMVLQILTVTTNAPLIVAIPATSTLIPFGACVALDIPIPRWRPHDNTQPPGSHPG